MLGVLWLLALPHLPGPTAFQRRALVYAALVILQLTVSRGDEGRNLSHLFPVVIPLAMLDVQRVLGVGGRRRGPGGPAGRRLRGEHGARPLDDPGAGGAPLRAGCPRDGAGAGDSLGRSPAVWPPGGAVIVRKIEEAVAARVATVIGEIGQGCGECRQGRSARARDDPQGGQSQDTRDVDPIARRCVAEAVSAVRHRAGRTSPRFWSGSMTQYSGMPAASYSASLT